MASWSEKLNQMTQSAISKSKEVAGVAKLNVEISSLNQSVKNIYTEVYGASSRPGICCVLVRTASLIT